MREASKKTQEKEGTITLWLVFTSDERTAMGSDEGAGDKEARKQYREGK